jgi:AAHS family 4-hydroxybenzoate transporter-like MFS transporter
MGHAIPADVAYVERETSSGAKPRVGLGEVFAPTYVRDTAALFAAFFFCLMANYFAILLIPTVFRGAGFEQADANLVLQLFNWGGVAGALIGALVIQQLGSRIAMLGMSALAVGTSLALAGMTIEAPASLLLMSFMIVTGALLNGVQTTMYALTTHVYPTEIRSTGLGAVVAFGRIGNVLAAPVANGALDRGGNSAYFGAWAAAMAVVTLALAAMKRHVPRSRDLPAAAALKT